MTQEQKAKKYDEALEWMRKVYPTLTGAAKEDAEHYFPELKESEDERIRKELLAVINDLILPEEQQARFNTWLEKQKEHKPITINQNEKEFLADEITAFLCNYDKEFDGEDPVPSEVAEHFYLLGKQAQKQKPSEWSEEEIRTIFDDYVECRDTYTSCINRLKSLHERFSPRPEQEWSEEDKRKLNRIYKILGYAADDKGFLTSKRIIGDKEAIELQDFLKSLRPQPHKETYQAAKHDLAIRFMNYLDENRPEGKMCLSNGECEDIEKAFKENDWAKIIRYVKKYHQSEQKPEVKLTGWAMRGINEEVWVRLDRKSFPDLKDEPMEVEITIKKKNAEL